MKRNADKQSDGRDWERWIDRFPPPDDSQRESSDVEQSARRRKRLLDMTPQAEALFRFTDQTIDTELADELSFLASYDRAKKTIQTIVDMPDRKIDLFIRFCLQNNGQLSVRKRTSQFSFLLDEEIAHMEQSVQSSYNLKITRTHP